MVRKGTWKSIDAIGRTVGVNRGFDRLHIMIITSTNGSFFIHLAHLTRASAQVRMDAGRWMCRNGRWTSWKMDGLHVSTHTSQTQSATLTCHSICDLWKERQKGVLLQ